MDPNHSKQQRTQYRNTSRQTIAGSSAFSRSPRREMTFGEGTTNPGGSATSDGNASVPLTPAHRRSMELTQAARQRRQVLTQMATTQSTLSSTASTIIALQPKIDNRPALVIEIGTRLTRIGFAAELVPREIFRSEWLDPISGPAPSKPMPLFDRSRTEQQQYEVLVKFLKDIVFRKLLTTVCSRRVVIVESLLTPTWVRQALARALFKCPSLNAHSVLFAPSHLLCSLAFNARTCLVLDLGAEEAVLFPIAEGVLMLNQWETSSACCALAVEQNLKQLMLQFGRVRRTRLAAEDKDDSGLQEEEDVGRTLNERDLELAGSMRLWEDLVVRFCFVTTAARGKRLQAHLFDPVEHPFEGPAPPLEFQFGAELLHIPGLVREGAAEVMFACENEPGSRSVAQMLLDCLAGISIDLRRELLQNVLVVGGVSRLPGFLARLKTELLGLLADGQLYPQLAPLCDIRFFQFPREMAGQLFCAWLGGSMFGALDDILEKRSFTRKDWLSGKQIPDWTNAIDVVFASMGTDNAEQKGKTQEEPNGLEQHKPAQAAVGRHI